MKFPPFLAYAFGFLCLSGLFAAGIGIQWALSLTVPGAVLGLVVLGAVLARQKEMPPALERVADYLISHMNLFFIPAGVGVMGHLSLVAKDLWPILIALFVSTLLGVATTALVFKWMVAHGEEASEDG